MQENEISRRIVVAAVEVHRTLGGPGLLESVYEEALFYELTQIGLQVERQVNVPIYYKETLLATPLRLDMCVNQCVLIECKSQHPYNSIAESQLLTYLRLTAMRLGLVINFGEKYVRDGIHRVVNNLR